MHVQAKVIIAGTHITWAGFDPTPHHVVNTFTPRHATPRHATLVVVVFITVGPARATITLWNTTQHHFHVTTTATPRGFTTHCTRHAVTHAS